MVNAYSFCSGTILLPGTTQLTSDDLGKRLVKAEVDSVVGDAATAAKVEEALASVGGKAKINHKVVFNTSPLIKKMKYQL